MKRETIKEKIIERGVIDDKMLLTITALNKIKTEIKEHKNCINDLKNKLCKIESLPYNKTIVDKEYDFWCSHIIFKYKKKKLEVYVR